MMKKIILWTAAITSGLDNLIFYFTNLIFSVIPITMILGGGGFAILYILVVLLDFFFFHEGINFSNCFSPLLGFLLAWMGFKWDDVIIENYEYALERKKNGEKCKWWKNKID